MKRSTLLTIKDIVYNLDKSCCDLHELLDLLNLTPDERVKIEDALLVTLNKVDKIKNSQISNLEDHIEIEYIEKYTK